MESVRTYNDYTRAGAALGDVGWYHQQDFLKWLAHLTGIGQEDHLSQDLVTSASPASSPGDLDPSRSLTPVDAKPKDVVGSAPASPVRPGPSQASGSRKRQSDVIFIDDDDAKQAPSRRQKRTFQSDSITDAEYQQLLEETISPGGQEATSQNQENDEMALFSQQAITTLARMYQTCYKFLQTR